MALLVAIILLPLAVIAAQIATGATGAVGNSIYKLAFIIPPLMYCRMNGIRLSRDIFKWHHWRHDLGLAALLGAAGAAIFIGAYVAFGVLLVDKPAVAAKIHLQFSVNAATVLAIAPFTILINSFIEEFFYRGFAFNLLASKNALVGTLLPAGVFTVQHLLFIYHWVSPLPLGLAVVALLVFALALQALYAKADTIVAPWLVHVMGDLAMMAIAIELVLV